MTRKLRYLFVLFIATFAFTAFATPNPTSMLSNTTDKLLASIKASRPKLKSNPNYIYTIVNRILLPHVDTVAMAQSALGRQGWMKASPDQRKAFTETFTTTVIRTYASALNAYTNETVKYYPIRGGYQGKTLVRVQSKILRNDGPPVPISYSLILRGNTWKVYDMNVEGVSLLQSFRSQFSQQLSQGWSISKLISNLKAHNQKITSKKNG